jgi:hypothetical protein
MRLPVLLAAACLAASLAGCAGTPPAIPKLAFTAADYSFSGPTEVTGRLVELSLQNTGHEPHHVALARIDAGHTMDDLRQAMVAQADALPAWSHWAGGVGPFAPGAQGTGYVTLEPGTYVLVCFVPDATGVPHFAHGMMAMLTVHAPTGAAPSEPSPDLALTLHDFSFTLDHAPAAGHQTWRVDNAGSQVHEAILVRLEPGATGQSFTAAFGPNATGPPPGTFVGGFSEQDPGMHGLFTVDLGAGHYVLLCFVTDPASKAPHFALGMMHEFTIA